MEDRAVRRPEELVVPVDQRCPRHAERLRRQGVDVVDLGAGEPDFGTPDHVKEAAHAALNSNFTKYTPSAGVQEVREAVAQRYRIDHGVDIKAEEVIDYTRRDNVAEKLAKKFGAALADASVRAMRTAPALR